MRCRFTTALVAALFAAVFSEVAYAGAITYTATTTGSGSLGGTNFSNALITITGTGDTSDVQEGSSSKIFLVPISASVTVAGIGSGTFTDEMRAVVNQSVLVAGISNLTKNRFVLGPNNPAFSAYDLKSSIGPLSGSSAFNSGFAFPTTAGNFIITSSSTASFTPSTVSIVPEPSSFALLGIGGLGLAVGAYRRRRVAV